MQNYVSNRYCQCARCRLNGVMGPVILITLGVLILLSQTGMAEFNRTWPVILLVIGAVKLMQGSASVEGHVGPGGTGGAGGSPISPASPTTPVPPSSEVNRG